MMKKLLKIVIMLYFFSYNEDLLAGTHISASAGVYSITGQNGTRSIKVNGFGTYRFGISHDLTQKLQAKIGYTVTYESILTGDSIFGLDIGGSWLFLGPSLFKVYKSDGVVINITRKWSPYAGIHFNQRQFQSNKASFSGLGIHAGSHFPISDNFTWHAEIRHNNLSGPSNSTATDTSVLIGVSSEF